MQRFNRRSNIYRNARCIGRKRNVRCITRCMVGCNEVRGIYIMVPIQKLTAKPYVRDANLFSTALLDG